MDADPPIRRTRKDADRNRRRIIESASQVFQEQGLKASLAEVARRAEVGIGTLYRHFAGRDELVAAIVADDLTYLLSLADQALLADDPWEALVGFCLAQTEQGARRRVIRELVVLHDARPNPGAMPSGGVFPRLELLVERARSHGDLRPDATPQDFILMLSAMARVVEVTADVAPDQWRRALTLSLDGMRADGVLSRLPEPALGTAELEKGMFNLAQQNVAKAVRTTKPE